MLFELLGAYLNGLASFWSSALNSGLLRLILVGLLIWWIMERGKGRGPKWQWKWGCCCCQGRCGCTCGGCCCGGDAADDEDVVEVEAEEVTEEA